MATLATLAGSSQTGDYANPLCRHWRCDDPAASLHALVTGDVAGFFRDQPAMGLTSLALRAPAAAVSHLWGDTTLHEYRAGALICAVVALWICIALAQRAHADGVRLPQLLAFVALWACAILWSRSIFFGHPEEPLTAALAVAAIIAAAKQRPLLAGVLIGLAIGSKEWALLALPAVAFAAAAPEWRRMALTAGAAIVLTTGVMAVGNPSSFHSAHQAQQRGDRHTLTPATVWFRFGHKGNVVHQGAFVAYSVFPPKLVGRWCRPALIVIGLLASLLFWRRRGPGSRDVLALVAFILMLRVILDTQTFSYHLAPALMFLAAWEVLGRRRLPVVATLAMIAFELTVHVVVPNVSANAFNAIYLAWTLPLALYAGIVAFAARPAERQTLFSSLCS